MDDFEYEADFDPDALYENYDDYEDEYFDSSDYTLQDLWKDCLVPTISDGFASSAKLICCCALLKFTLSLRFLPSHVFHLTSSFLGVYCLYMFFRLEIFYILIFAIVGYVMLYITQATSKVNQGTVCAAICYIFLIICELFLADKKLWHRIRGCQMLLSMKLISLAFDTSHADKKLPDIISCFGYFFHPGTVIFGPWISFSNYMNSRLETNVNISWIFSIVRSILISFAFLTISTCWTAWIFPSSSLKWISAYRDALSFRSSHYFVSYLSQATATTSGLQDSTVAAAFEIEIPRSLVEVVVWWNVPMHFWLKTYVFKTTKPLGDFAAVLFTYAASSLLHGLNFQLAAVLLSLGFYTYIEHVLRRNLSSVFHACISARKCKPDCDHIFKHNHLYVRITNFGFGLLAMFHLAYLGVMFDSTSSLEDEGYNMSHTLQKWSDLNFASHWVALFTYLFYFLT